MDIIQAKKIVEKAILDIFTDNIKIKDDMHLVGSESLLDSMKLVELCVLLEDLADENGFEFNWTSETAMSKSRGMFRSVATLTAEFARQSKAS
jgi:acyl carrier protein